MKNCRFLSEHDVIKKKIKKIQTREKKIKKKYSIAFEFDQNENDDENFSI